MRSSRAVRVRALAVAVGIVAVVVLALQPKPHTAVTPTSSPGGSVAQGTVPGSTPRATPRATVPGGPLPSNAPPLGAEWATTTVDAHLHDLVPTPRGILAIGDDRRGGVVWISPTGVDWTVDDDSVVFDRAHLQAGAANAQLTVVVGCALVDGACAKSTAWWWTLKSGWKRIDTAAFGSATIDDVVATKASFLAFGRTDTGSPRLWATTNGAEWDEVASPAATGESIVAVAASADAFLVAGNEASEPLAWVSPDGRSWTRSVVAKAGTAAATTSFTGDFAVAGSRVTTPATGDAPAILAPALWTSADGRAWVASSIVDDENGPLNNLAAGVDGLFAFRHDCCGGFLVPPNGAPQQFQIYGVDRLIDGAAGLLGIEDRAFTTSPAVIVHPPLGPVVETGQGYTPTPDLPVARPMTGAADPSGRLYVFSAVGSTGTLRVDRLDPTTNRWTRLRDVAAGIRDAKATVAANGMIYLVGVTVDGRHGRTIGYNPAKQTWRLRAPMPTARTGFGIALPTDGSIYVFGGRASPCCAAGSDGALAVVERYDPRADRWTRLGPMPLPAAAPGAVSAATSATAAPGAVNVSVQLTAVDGSGPLAPGPIIYVFLDARVWAYDPKTGAWTAGPANLSYGVTGSPVVGVDGIVRVFNCDRYDLYDPFMNHWQTGQALDQGRCSAVAVASNNAMIYVFGGDYLPSPGRSVSAFFAGGG